MLEFGRSEEHIANQFACSPTTVRNTLSLLDAPVAVRKAVESGQISVSDGYKLARLEPDEARKKVERLKAEAPRIQGKKRSQNAKKAREIVTGKKPSTGRPPAREPASEPEPSTDLQAEHRVKKMLATVETDERINENKRMGAIAALRWVLGDEGALGEIMDVQETGS